MDKRITPLIWGFFWINQLQAVFKNINYELKRI